MQLICLDSIDSTNTYAQRLLAADRLTENTVILALEQTAGKGQRGKTWHSSAGMGLYLSCVFFPREMELQNQYLFNKAMAGALAEFCSEKTNRKVSIKWPNDILVKDEKLAGMLIETNIRGSQINSLVVGIGVNLNQIAFEGEFETSPVSMALLTGTRYDVMSLAVNLIEKLEHAYRLFRSSDFSTIEEKYRLHLYRLNELSAFTADEQLFEAKLIDVDNQGAAILEKSGELMKAIHPLVRFAMK